MVEKLTTVAQADDEAENPPFSRSAAAAWIAAVAPPAFARLES
jgi:hypothetical protein